MMKKLFVLLILVCSAFFAIGQTPGQQLISVADSLYKASDNKAALALYKDAIKEIQNAKEPSVVNLAYANDMAGMCHYNLKQYRPALEYWHTALMAYKAANYTVPYKRLLANTYYTYAQIAASGTNESRKKFTKEETVNIIFPINEVRQAGDSFLVTIGAGEFDGLFPGARGHVKGTHYVNLDKRNITLGQLRVTTVDEYIAHAVVWGVNMADTLLQPWVGDMANVPARVERRTETSVLYDISVIGISFLNYDGDQIVGKQFILEYDSPELEEMVLSVMADVVIETGDAFSERTGDVPALLQIIGDGRFKGKTLLDAMLTTTPDDVRGFLYFVQSFPGKYMGRSWKISETYATWLINNAPTSHAELLKRLKEAKTETEFAALVMKNDSAIIHSDFYLNWQVKSQAFSKAGKYAEANEIGSIMMKVADVLKSDSLKAWAWFNEGYIASDASEIERSLKAYAEAEKMFTKLGNKNGLSFASNNLARGLSSNKQYQLSAKKYEEVIKLKLDLYKKEGHTDDQAHSIGLAYWGKAISLEKLSKFTEALESYHQAVSWFEKSTEIKSIKGALELYGAIGEIFNKQGDYQKAIEYFEKQLQKYPELGDQKGYAKALDKIAFTYNKLGKSKEALELYQKSYDLKLKLDEISDAAFSKSNVAQTQWQLGNYNDAISSHNKAIELAAQSADSFQMAYSYQRLGSLYRESGDPNNAISSFGKAEEIYTALKAEELLGKLYTAMGDNFYDVKNYGLAAEYYQKSADVFKKLENRYSYAEGLFNIGRAYYAQNEYDMARGPWNEALKIQREIGDKEGQLYTLTNLALIKVYKDFDYAGAQTMIEEAQKLAEETNSRSQIAWGKKMLAIMFDEKGEFAKSESYYREVLAIYRELGDKPAELNLFLNMASHYLSMGLFDSSAYYYNMAATVGAEQNNRVVQASAFQGLSDLDQMKGEYALALQNMEKAMQIFREVENEWGIVGALIGKGNIYNRTGEYEKAIVHYKQADSIYIDLNYEIGRSTPLNNIGTIYYWQGDYVTSLSYIQQAHKLIDKPGSESTFLVMVKTNLGEIYIHLNQLEEAEKWLQDAYSLASKMESKSRMGSVLDIRGRLYMKQGKLTLAQKDLEEAYNIFKGIGEKMSIADAATYLGKVYYGQKNFTKAAEYLSEAIAISKETGVNKYLWQAQYALALIMRDQNQADSSIALLKSAITTVEDIRSKVSGGEAAKELFSKSKEKMELYTTIAALLAAQGQEKEAMAYLSAGSRENVSSKFTGAEVVTDEKQKELKLKVEGLESAEQKELSKPSERQNKELLAKLQSMKVVAEQDYQKFVFDLKEKGELDSFGLKGNDPMKHYNIITSLPEDLALVQYMMAGEKLYIFVSTSDSAFAKIVEVSDKLLQEKIKLLYEMMHRPAFVAMKTTRAIQMEEEQSPSEASEADFMALSQELYELLIATVRPEISSRKKLAILPHKSLYYIPFEALGYVGDNGRFNYLFSDFQIFYSNDLMFLMKQGSLSNREINLIAFGNTDKSLPNAEKEVNYLKTLYPAAQIFLQLDATKDKLINSQQRFDVVHFATHGVLDYSEFSKSYLLMASGGGKADDGRFSIDEIRNIRKFRGTELVTLSACETALTYELVSGWPVNTGTVFLEGGAAAVLATLWKVDDEATGLLMQQFYQNVKTMNKAEALQKAQEHLYTQTRYKHPYYWAPFVLLGNWK